MDALRGASKAVDNRKPSKPSKTSLVTSESTDQSYTEPPSFEGRTYLLKHAEIVPNATVNASLYEFDRYSEGNSDNKEQAKSMWVTCEIHMGITSLVLLHDMVSRRLRKLGLLAPVLIGPPDRESPPSLVLRGEHSFESRPYNSSLPGYEAVR